jgi:hypothetical protein
MIQTRTFDDLCRSVLDDVLKPHRFAWVGNGTYARAESDGEDTIGFDLRPTRERFCVMIGHFPSDLRILHELHPELGVQDRGFLCKPYLNPTGTSWHPRWWRAKDRPTAEKSLRKVVACIQGPGLSWLALLRDPRFYAEHTDPVAALGSGLAHERAGNLTIARERYEQIMRRFGEIEKAAGVRRFREGWRDFIFIAAKLGVEDDLVRAVRDLAGWNPTIHPLSASGG